MQEAARVGKKRAPEMVVTWIEIQAYNIGRAYPDGDRDFE